MSYLCEDYKLHQMNIQLYMRRIYVIELKEPNFSQKVIYIYFLLLVPNALHHLANGIDLKRLRRNKYIKTHLHLYHDKRL